jgi:hypothetical protein
MKIVPADKELLRILRHLAKRGVSLMWQEGRWAFAGAAQPLAWCQAEAVERLSGRGLIDETGPGRLVISATGTALLRRSLASAGDDFAAQHQERIAAIVTDGGHAQAVTLNQAESPLAWLRSRRDGTGKPFIDAVQFAAGERLRSDYSRGRIMPRVTANWSAAVADGRRGGAGGMAEITEAAIAARRRVERALAAVGPDLSGLLIDFCCFLKGLEEVERERRWPARSAKVVLQLALAALARHYGLDGTAKGRTRGSPIRQWGAADYRPSIT